MTRSIAVLLLGSALLGPLPRLAAAQDAPPTPTAATGTGAPTRGKDASERVGRYIADLHRRLGIKPEQGAQWDAFATVMRGNAVRQEAEYNRRRAGGPSTAVDDLRAYAESEHLRAADVDRLVPAFEALYQSMDAGQRANADKVFKEVQRRRPR